MSQGLAAAAATGGRVLGRQPRGWLALLCLALQLSTALHMLVVKHGHCVEHGEWTHAGDEHAESHVDGHRPPPGESALSAASSGDGGHGHEHCLVCGTQRKSAIVPPSLATLQAWLGQRCEPARIRSDASFDATQVYSVAPKTSPPRV